MFMLNRKQFPFYIQHSARDCCQVSFLAPQCWDHTRQPLQRHGCICLTRKTFKERHYLLGAYLTKSIGVSQHHRLRNTVTCFAFLSKSFNQSTFGFISNLKAVEKNAKIHISRDNAVCRLSVWTFLPSVTSLCKSSLSACVLSCFSRV